MKINITFKKEILVFIVIGLLINSNLLNAQGPNAPEAASFEPIDATDMVNLFTGDLAYIVPLINIPSPEGGYPLTLSYHAGIAMDQEASWVGLGWSLNPGSINRNVNGSPDDWKDALVKEFAYDEGGSESTTVISLGFGISGAYSIGISASWGSHRSIGGSISMAGFYGGLGTDGASVGVNINNKVSVGASLGFNGGGGINASFGSNSSINLGVGTNSGGLNGSISISQVTTAAGHRSSLGISFSSSSFGYTANINGVGTSSSMSLASSINAGDYNVQRQKSGFTVTTPWGYFSFGKNKVKWELSKITNLPSNGILYYSDLASRNNFRRIGYPTAGNEDNVAIGTAKYYEQSLAESLMYTNNGLIPNVDNYSVAAQGIGGSIAPTFLNNAKLLGESRSFSHAGLMRFTVYEWYIDEVIDQDRKRLYFDFDDFSNTYLSVIPKRMEFYEGNTVLDNDILFEEDILDGTLPIDYLYDTNNSLVSHPESFSTVNKRRRNGKYVEYFTNAEINSGVAASKGFLDIANGFQRDIGNCGIYTSIDYQNNNNIFNTSIGGYKITDVDGKTYHYSLPVYQAEQVRRIYGVVEGKNENQAHVDRMNLSPYATHWLLTAITGPDYIKSDINRSYPEEGDYGYWVRFDYGKWSNGYVWKTPNGEYSENVDVFGNVKEYSWGRKQIYYLDKIKTRTHTAIFFKSLRNDNKSKQMQYKNLAHYKIPEMEFMNVTSHPLLKLEKIILLNNNDANNIHKNGGAPLLPLKSYNYYLTGIQTNNGYGDVYWEPTNAYKVDYQVNISDNVYDINDLAVTNAEEDALKVIELTHNYSLALGSPNSNGGKLTLNNIEFKGKGAVSIMPKMIFSYGNNYYYDFSKKNDFGYYKNKPEAWSLNNITTQTGAKINITYESDTYGKSAIKNGRVFTSQLKFTFITEPPQGNSDYWPEGITRIKIQVDDQDSTTNGLMLSDFFDEQQPFFFDMWYSAVYNHSGSGYDRSSVNVNSQMATIIELNSSQNYMIVDVLASSPNFRDVFQHSAEPVSVLNAGGDYVGVENQNLPRFELAWTPESGWRKYSMRHTLIGNKLRPNDGFGIRVKQISINDLGINYITHYSYENPNTNQSSGIIPYYPEPNYSINQQVPYVSLLPAPMVTYEYVTESSSQLSKRYKFKVLGDYQEEINNQSVNFGELLKIESTGNNLMKNIKIETNLKALGRLEEIETFNLDNQKISKVVNNYKSINGSFSVGQIQQSFYKKKLVGVSLGLGEVSYASVTSMITKSSALESITDTKNSYMSTSYMESYDFLTGHVLETITEDSRGNRFKTEILPAYTVSDYNPSGGYGMGAKVDNITNKNMLTQTTMSKSYIDDNGTWKITGVGISTWNNNWTYTSISGSESSPTALIEKIWRKHKTYAWNGSLNEDGTYQNFVGIDDNFNWSIALSAPQPNPNWKKVSTVTKYDHFSIPLEVKDINDNFASTKMDGKNEKIISTSNTSYDEQFYSGAEEGVNGWTGGQVNIWNFQSDLAHTGKYSEKAGVGSKNFKCIVKPKLHLGQASKRYKISVWVYRTNNQQARIYNGTSVVPFNGETITAGNWIQYNHYVDLSSQKEIYVTSNSGSVRFDDFRLHPAASSMTSYVYNEWDELSYILGANNLGTHFIYDAEGRLIETQSELIYDPTNNIEGGFKTASRNYYNYKNQ